MRWGSACRWPIHAPSHPACRQKPWTKDAPEAAGVGPAQAAATLTGLSRPGNGTAPRPLDQRENQNVFRPGKARTHTHLHAMLRRSSQGNPLMGEPLAKRWNKGCSANTGWHCQHGLETIRPLSQGHPSDPSGLGRQRASRTRPVCKPVQVRC